MAEQPIAAQKESTSRDVEFLRRWKSGDVTGFNALMSRYERPLYRLIWKVVRNDHDAQDILQETFIRLYRNVGRLRDNVSLQPWLFRTASNLSIDHLRKIKPGRMVSLEKQQETTGQEPEGIQDKPPDDPHRHTLRKQLERHLIDAVNRLPRRQRLAMTLRCLQDLSMREIAEILKCKEQTVGTTLFAARKKLMEELEPLLSDLLHVQ
ncbi:MAG: sigma-70 family RNA polymerase sigma factor [bacterium]